MDINSIIAWFARGVLGAALAVLWLPSSTQAASSLGFAISPPTVELRAEPGQSVTGKVSIINLTDLPIVLNVDRHSFVAKGEEGQVDLVEEAPLYTLAPWFRAPTTVEVAARATKAVEFSIDVPANAEPGGRFGALVFNTAQSKLPSGQSGAAVKQELAALIFLRIAGDANEQIKVESFKTNHKFYEYGPVKFETRVGNAGNVHAKPTGHIVIKNMFGIKVGTIEVDAKNVLPDAIRRLSAEWPKKLLVGRYTATLELKNDDQQALTATTTFVAVPYRLMGLLLIILVILYLTIWRRRKRLGRALGIIFGKD